MLQWPGPAAQGTGPSVMTASPSGKFVAQCYAGRVEVKRLEWACNNVPQAEKKQWKGAKPTPPISFGGGGAAVPAQLWLSNDACTVAALVIDAEDPNHRELYVIGRDSAASEWSGAQWLAKPELAPPYKAQGLNLSAQDMYLGVVRVVFTHTPEMGRCCHISHTWRRITEGDPYRGDLSQLLVNVRAICIKLDHAQFKKQGGELQLLHREPRPRCRHLKLLRT